MRLRPRNCDQEGHDLRRVMRRVWYYPSTGYRGVVDDAKQSRQVCRGWFCDYATSWAEVDGSRSTINSFSAPPTTWDRLKDKGVCVQ